MVDVNDLYRRYTALKNECTRREIKRSEQVRSILTALQSITGDEVNLLATDVPMLAAIVTYTEDDLLNDPMAIANIRSVYSEITHLMDDWLCHFEGEICI